MTADGGGADASRTDAGGTNATGPDANDADTNSVDAGDADANGVDAGERAADLARSSALGRVATEGLSGRTLLASMGGVRGLVEALAPGIAFLVIYTVTRDLVWSVAVPAALSVIFIVARLVVRQSVMPAVAGFIGAAISGFLALRSGDGSDYFVIGFYTNGAYALAFLISSLVRWPLIGVVAGLLFSSGRAWRENPQVRRWMHVATLTWVAFFAVRLAVQLPLYFTDQVVALGVTRLVMGTPMYAILIVVTALFVRSVFVTAGLSGDRSGDGRVAR